MKSAKKGETTRVRPFKGDLELAQEIADFTGLPLIEVLSQAMSAGLKAIKQNGYVLPAPLTLQVIQSFKSESPALPPARNHQTAQEGLIPKKDKGKK